MDMKVLPLTVQAQTVAKLRDAILSGVFAPGERLVESLLCERMGVSRTSIREALRRLEAERLVTILPNRGPSVAEVTWTEAEQIYEVRALLEGEAAALFAKRATAAQLKQLSDALAEFDRAVKLDNPLERLSSTERFYEVILEGCGNQIIAEILQGLVARITFLRARSMSRPGRSRLSATELRRMLDAVHKRDSKAARKAATEHIVAACSAAREVFENESREAAPRRTKRRTRNTSSTT
jgi:DNA-binding GntR family transcriptional regulator